jgi:hypothetical protein
MGGGGGGGGGAMLSFLEWTGDVNTNGTRHTTGAGVLYKRSTKKGLIYPKSLWYADISTVMPRGRCAFR